LQREARSLRSALAAREDDAISSGVIGHAKALRDLLDLARQVADAPVSVLVTGENGTGKQQLARLIHQWSGRRAGPLINVKCGALGDTLAASASCSGKCERGVVIREGRLREADGGTLVLADVDELPLAPRPGCCACCRSTGSSARRRRGAQRRPAGDRVDQQGPRAPGQGRQVARGPLLSARRGQPAHAVAARAAGRHPAAGDALPAALGGAGGQAGGGLQRAGARGAAGCDWPGNIRQLEHCVERAVVMCRGAEIEPRDLPRELMSRMRGDDAAPVIPGASLRELERFAILRTLEHVGGSTSKAAKILGISPRKIQYRLNEYRGLPGASGSGEYLVIDD
jgi:transcriptional regulator of acetoin/glycerol metabolism